MIKEVLEELENTRFPLCKSRKNISSEGVEAFVLGEVNYRGQKLLGYKTRGPSRYNKKFKVLFDKLKKFIAEKKPEFEYTTIQVKQKCLL
jgi:hypothetical protein